MRIHCTEELHRHGGPGRFILARAEEALPSLIDEYGGQVQLIYLDPPFGTGDSFHLRLPGGRRGLKLPAFSDTLSEEDYLAWMRRVLTGCHALLSDEGCLYLHIDYRMCAPLRLLLDEIFGKGGFMNEIIWSYKSGGRSTRYYPRKHDNILFYRKSRKVYFNIQAVGRPRGAARRNHMKRYVDEHGRICFSIRSGGKLYTYYEDTPIYPSDVWADIEHLQQKDGERVGYATQKPEALLERILLASSREGDLVMDLFSGSGTTAAVASRLHRRYVALDASPIALYTLRARLLRTRNTQPLLPTDGGAGAEPGALHICFGTAPPTDAPMQLSYALRRNAKGFALTLEQACFDEADPPLYLALGTAAEDCFLPLLTDDMPSLPKVYQIPMDVPPVLQLTDMQGRQAFVLLEEDPA